MGQQHNYYIQASNRLQVLHSSPTQWGLRPVKHSRAQAMANCEYLEANCGLVACCGQRLWISAGGNNTLGGGELASQWLIGLINRQLWPVVVRLVATGGEEWLAEAGHQVGNQARGLVTGLGSKNGEEEERRTMAARMGNSKGRHTTTTNYMRCTNYI